MARESPVGIQGETEILHRSAHPDTGLPDPQGRSVGDTTPNTVRGFLQGDSQTERPDREDDASQCLFRASDGLPPISPGGHHQGVVRVADERHLWRWHLHLQHRVVCYVP